MMRTTRRVVLGGAGALAMPAILQAQGLPEISLYFPIAVGGPITTIIDGYAQDFTLANPTIKVTPIYAGTYQDTLTKAQTALKAGAGPQLAVLLSSDVLSLIDNDLIVPIDALAETPTDRAWLDSFYPAFLRDGEVGGHTWGVPFQRSTIVLFWNKAAFKETGPDPETPPATWQEHADFATKITKRSGASVSRWGVEIPSSGFPYWLFQALVTEAGGTLANSDGTETDFAGPAEQEALQYWIGLTTKYRAHPPGATDWSTDAARLPETAGGHDLDHDRQPVEYPHQREVSVRRGDATRRQAPWQPDGWRQFLHLHISKRTTGAGLPEVPALG